VGGPGPPRQGARRHGRHPGTAQAVERDRHDLGGDVGLSALSDNVSKSALICR